MKSHTHKKIHPFFTFLFLANAATLLITLFFFREHTPLYQTKSVEASPSTEEMYQSTSGQTKVTLRIRPMKTESILTNYAVSSSSFFDTFIKSIQNLFLPGK